MVAFLASLVITGLMCGAIVWVAKRRPVGQPLTWGEAFIAGIWVFTILFLAYGVIPDRFLIWADNELNWRSDRLITMPWSDNPGLSFGGRGRVLISYQTLRDLIATGIYIVFLVMNIVGWLMWQKRGRKGPAELPTSAYGRPLVKQV